MSGTSTYRLIQGAMLVVLVTAFVTSFQSGSAGAGFLGFDPHFVASLPLVCDVIAGVATAIHGRVRRDKQMRRLASWFVLVPMVFSWGANSVDHVFRASKAAEGWSSGARSAWFFGVVLAAGICPVAVAALLHLSTRFVEFEQRAASPPKPASPPTRRATEVSAPSVALTPAKPRPKPQPAPAEDELAAARRERERIRKAQYRAAKRAEQEQAHG